MPTGVSLSHIHSLDANDGDAVLVHWQWLVGSGHFVFVFTICFKHFGIVHILGTRNWSHRSMSWARPLLHAPATGTGTTGHIGESWGSNPAADAVIFFSSGTQWVCWRCLPWFMDPFISVDRQSCWRWRNLFSFMYFWYPRGRLLGHLFQRRDHPK